MNIVKMKNLIIYKLSELTLPHKFLLWILVHPQLGRSNYAEQRTLVQQDENQLF
jgi:hypothetical protein